MVMRVVRIGLASVRANAVPMFLLWLASVCTVLAYYLVPGFGDVLAPLARWQREGGFTASFLNRVAFCGVLPGVFLCSVRPLRPARPMATVAVQSLWAGCWGIACDFFYRLLDAWLGTEIDWQGVLVKTAVNQLPWTVLVVAPANAVFYFWLSRDLSVRRFVAEWPKGSVIRKLLLPNLVCNWCVWIPVTACVFAFPLVLRVQISGFAGALWALLILRLSVIAVPACDGDGSRSLSCRNAG